MQYTLSIMIFRGVLGGLVIVSAIVVTKIGGPLIGGMFVMFPAMFVVMIFITYFSHGTTFSAAVIKSSILGAISVVIYGIMVRYTYLTLGFIGGTVVSMAVSFASSCVIHRYLMRKTS